MSRIRSVHPGLATDEAYMALSHAAARILPLLWCECDDQGVFEWKPLTLKARLLPAHHEDMPALLTELEGNGFVKRIEVSGKSFGLVRNFRRFQRPKKPNAVHVLPAEFRTYVGLSDDDTEPDPPSEPEGSPPLPHQSPTSGEKPPQMEDGGWREGDRQKESDAPASVAAKGETTDERRAGATRGSRLPADWEPDEACREFARDLGLDPDDAKLEFRDYWCAVPGTRGLKTDWPATFRNRCREIAKRPRGIRSQQPYAGRQEPVGVVAALRNLGARPGHG